MSGTRKAVGADHLGGFGLDQQGYRLAVYGAMTGTANVPVIDEAGIKGLGAPVNSVGVVEPGGLWGCWPGWLVADLRGGP